MKSFEKEFEDIKQEEDAQTDTEPVNAQKMEISLVRRNYKNPLNSEETKIELEEV